MGAKLKHIQFTVSVVPISANALETAGAIIERVSHYADFRLFNRYDFAIEKGVAIGRHRNLLVMK